MAILLSAVLAFTGLATPTAAFAADPQCGVATGTLQVDGPTMLFGVVGVPLAAAQFTTDSIDPVSWRGDCADLPNGVTFDPVTASYVGTPTSTFAGTAYLLATDTGGSTPYEASFTILPASALQVAMKDPVGVPLDTERLYRGSAFELHSSGMPDDAVVEATLDGDLFGEGSPDSGGVLSIAGEIPDDATAGAHTIAVEFIMPGASAGGLEQRYSTQLPVTVRAVSLGGPRALTPVAGTAVSYSFPAVDSSGSVAYSLVGSLPAGLTLDAAAGTISGTAVAASAARSLELVATDDRGSVTAQLSLSVLAQSVVVPSFGALAGSSSLLALEALDDDMTPGEALDAVSQQSRPWSSGGTIVTAGIDPLTGESYFQIGQSPVAQPRSPTMTIGTDQATRERELGQLEAMARLAAAKADLEAAKAAVEQREQDRLDALKNRQNALLLALEAEKRLAAIHGLSEANPLPVGTAVKVEFHSTPVLLASTVVGASGGFVLVVNAPANMSPGLHHLVVTYTLPDGTVYTSAMEITVLGLAETGPVVDPVVIAGGGLALLLAGLGLLAVARVRTRTLRNA